MEKHPAVTTKVYFVYFSFKQFNCKFGIMKCVRKGTIQEESSDTHVSQHTHKRLHSRFLPL